MSHPRAARRSTATSALLHAWVTHPRSVYWEMQGASLDDVATRVPPDRREPAPRRLARPGRRRAGVPRRDLRPRTTASWPALPELRPGDLGMHVLVAPDRRPGARLHPRGVPRGDGALLRRPGRTPRGRRARRPQRADPRPEHGGRLPEARDDAPCATKEAALSFCTRDDHEGGQ